MGSYGDEVFDVADFLGNPADSRNVMPLPMDERFWGRLSNRKILLFRPSWYTLVPPSVGDVVLPSSMDLVFMPGATLNIPEGVTLHIHGRVEAGDFPIFCEPGAFFNAYDNGTVIPLFTPCKGKVRLLSPRQRRVSARWWGTMPAPVAGQEGTRALALDSGPALERALRCASVERINRVSRAP